MLTHSIRTRCIIVDEHFINHEFTLALSVSVMWLPCTHRFQCLSVYASSIYTRPGQSTHSRTHYTHSWTHFGGGSAFADPGPRRIHVSTIRTYNLYIKSILYHLHGNISWTHIVTPSVFIHYVLFIFWYRAIM